MIGSFVEVLEWSLMTYQFARISTRHDIDRQTLLPQDHLPVILETNKTVPVGLGDRFIM
jgi:hypothetical protein